MRKIGEHSERLGSGEKLRRIINIATEEVPRIVKQELSDLGIGETLGGIIDEVVHLVDKVVQYLDDKLRGCCVGGDGRD